MIADVLPDTCARTMTVSPMTAVSTASATMTDGGCAGSTVTDVDTDSVKPLASVAVAVTV